MKPHRDSLDRFLEARAFQIVGRSTVQTNSKIQLIVGGSLLAIALGLIVGGLFGPRELMYGAIGPGVAGVTNTTIGVALRRRIGPSPVGQVDYSKDARDLIYTLWRKQSPPPSDEVIQYLERAAKAYQRLAAVIATNRTLPSLAKMGSRAAFAAEDTMAQVFDQASALYRYPESGAAARRPLESRIETLEEIALRLEELASQSPQSLDVNRSSVDDFLTDLRLEVLARAELHAPDNQHQQSQRPR